MVAATAACFCEACAAASVGPKSAPVASVVVASVDSSLLVVVVLGVVVQFVNL